MALPQVVSPAEWRAAHEQLLAKEKAATRAHDALAAQRRRQPITPVEKEYVFEGPDGPLSLLNLFEGRSQLIVYHFMFQPGGDPCTGCSMFVDNVGHLAHLNVRDTTMALVSPAPLAETAPYKARMGWDVPWYQTTDDFNADHGITGGFGLNIFLRDGDSIYRTYFTSGRGVEALGTNWTFLDLTPLGRQEEWEDSPAGWPQSPKFEWWRLHDEYES